MQGKDKLHFERVLTQADFLLQTRRYREAIVHARKALAIFPDDPRPYVQIAYAKASMKDLEAPEWARKAIEKEPENALWRRALSDTYTLQGRWDEGLQPMREAVAMAPENPRLQSGLGLCLLYAGKFKAAIPHLEKALELDPQDFSTHERLSIALSKVGDMQGSERHLHRALELKPDDPDLQNTLGWSLLEKGKRTEAAEVFYEALRLDPQLAPAKVGLGAPDGSKVSLTDRILRISVILSTLPHYRLIWGIHWIGLFILTRVLMTRGFQFPYANLWEVRLLALILVLWCLFFLFGPRIVKTIARRRGVHFF